MDKQYKMAPAGEHAVVWKGLKKQRNIYSAPLFFGELRASNAGMICAACVLNKVPESLSVAFLSHPPQLEMFLIMLATFLNAPSRSASGEFPLISAGHFLTSLYSIAW